MAQLKEDKRSLLAMCGLCVLLAACGGGAASTTVTVAEVSSFQITGSEVGTLAKAAGFNGDGLTIDRDGNIFVGTSKGGTIKRVSPNGEVTLFATLPSGSTANGSDFDSKGNLFVANEKQNTIHKITPDGKVSDFVVGLDGPAGVYVDENDNLIVGLYGDLATAAQGSKVIKISPEKVVTTVASGNGLENVVGVTGDGRGRYFASNFKNGELFEVTNGIVKKLYVGGVRVNHIKYASGYLYMPNPLENVVRRFDLLGNAEVVAGSKTGTPASKDGPSALATFARPNSIDMSADGKTLFVLDFDTGNVRTIKTGK